MESLALSAVDTATGAGVAALASAAGLSESELGLRLGLAIAGSALGLGLAYFEVYRRPLIYAPSLLRIVLTAAQFFALCEAKDSDVGAGLMAIPFFFLVCCAPVGSTSQYLHGATLLSSALNAVALAAAGIYYGPTPGSALSPARSAYAEGVRGFLAVTDVAFAVSGGLAATSLGSAAARGALLVLLFGFAEVPRGLLRGPTPEWLRGLYGAALVQAAQVHSCRLRLELVGVDDPQRCLMLLVACAMGVGYVERVGDPAHASFAVVAVVAASLLAWAVSTKFVQRND